MDELEQPKRQRRKSYRLQLHDTVRHIDKAIESATLREEKKADLLIHKTELLTKLLEMETERKKDSALIENETLRARVRELTKELDRRPSVPATQSQTQTPNDPYGFGAVAEKASEEFRRNHGVNTNTI